MIIPLRCATALALAYITLIAPVSSEAFGLSSVRGTGRAVHELGGGTAGADGLNHAPPAQAASPEAGSDPPGCAGLAVYAHEMLRAARESWASMMSETGIAMPQMLLLLEPEASRRLAQVLEDYSARLDAITPPTFVEAWHQNRVEGIRHLGNVASHAALNAGMADAILVYGAETDRLEGEERAPYEAAIAACPDFEQFWIDFESVDGESESPPNDQLDYSTCPGMEEYHLALDRVLIAVFAEMPEESRAFLEFAVAAYPWSLDPEKLLATAAFYDEVGQKTQPVISPDFAVAWHLHRAQSFDLMAQYIREAVENGVDAAEETFAEPFRVLRANERDAVAMGATSCAVFPEFVDREG